MQWTRITHEHAGLGSHISQRNNTISIRDNVLYREVSIFRVSSLLYNIQYGLPSLQVLYHGIIDKGAVIEKCLYLECPVHCTVYIHGLSNIAFLTSVIPWNNRQGSSYREVSIFRVSSPLYSIYTWFI